MIVREIRIYIEGGGEARNIKAILREGFSNFLDELRQIARNKQIKWSLILCGSRNNAFRDFKNALRTHPDAFNVLLVDSEAEVSKNPWAHLKNRDKWVSSNIDDAHCHLMVQTMETWIVADIEALKEFYGQGFKEKSIPKTPEIEKIDRKLLAKCLKEATRGTSKGEYHKTRHAPKLLGQLDAREVRHKAPHCERLFETLITAMK